MTDSVLPPNVVEAISVLGAGNDADAMVIAAGVLTSQAGHPQVSAALLGAATASDASARAGAIRALATAWDRHLAAPSDRANIEHALIAALDDDDPDVRFESARVAGAISAAKQKAGVVLLALLTAEETQTALLPLIIRGLARCGCPRSAIGAVGELARHEQDEIREAVAMALGTCDAPTDAADAVLCDLLDDDSPYVREEAVRSLAIYSPLSERARTALGIAAEDDDDVVAAAAAEALRTQAEERSRG